MLMSDGLLTVEEYLDLPDLGCPTELVRGRVVALPLPGFLHGVLSARLGGLLDRFVDEHKLGHVVNRSGVITERSPDTVRVPDVSFYSYSRIPKGTSPAGYAPVAPEIALEVHTPTDRWPNVPRRIAEYLNAGVDLVCVAAAKSRSVFAYTADRPPMPLGLDAEITFPPPLDGLRIPVRQVFES